MPTVFCALEANFRLRKEIVGKYGRLVGKNGGLVGKPQNGEDSIEKNKRDY